MEGQGEAKPINIVVKTQQQQSKESSFVNICMGVAMIAVGIAGLLVGASFIVPEVKRCTHKQ